MALLASFTLFVALSVVDGAARLALHMLRIIAVSLMSGIEQLSQLYLPTLRAFLMRCTPEDAGMNMSVRYGRKHLQIANRVIKSVLVFMMDHFAARKLSSKMQFHQIAMFRDFFIADAKHSVSILGDIAALKVAHLVLPINQPFALSRAKPLDTVLRWPTRWDKFLTAMFANLWLHGTNNTIHKQAMPSISRGVS